jgi:tetratricopeptide (TPR) repeat protein
VRESLAQVASEGIGVAERIDPASDSGAVDRAAQLRNYTALALIPLRRTDSAHRVIEGGLAAIAQGKRRADQNRFDLMLTEVLLHMRQGEVDSATRRPDQALAEFDTAVAIARQRHAVLKQVGSGRWLAIAHQYKGEMALTNKRYEEALAAYDSSVVRWGLYARRLRDPELHDSIEVVSGLQVMSVIRLRQEQAALQLGRLAAAIQYAWSATDTAAAVVAFRNSPDNQRALQRTYAQAMDLFETLIDHARADSAYDIWFRHDSTRAAGELSGSQAEVRPGMRAFDRSVVRILSELNRRYGRDTTGKSPAEQARLTRASEAFTRYREGLVWIRRQVYGRAASAEAKDSLGAALGNLSWSYLLVGRPKEAAGAASEGLQLSPSRTFMIPNWFNAVLLSAPATESERLFAQFAGQYVEDPQIRFECAVLRDLAVFRWIGVASDAQLQVAERLVAKSLLACPKPTSSTP